MAIFSLKEMAAINRYRHANKARDSEYSKSSSAAGTSPDDPVIIRGRKAISKTTGKEIPDVHWMTNASYGEGVATTAGNRTYITAKNRTRRYY